jgi:hypothetical protein
MMMKNDDKNSPENLVARTNRLAEFSKATGYNARYNASRSERRLRRENGQMQLFSNDTELDRRHPEEY